MAVVTPLNNPGGPEGDTVTVAEKLLNTEYCEALDSGLNKLALETQESANAHQTRVPRTELTH